MSEEYRLHLLRKLHLPLKKCLGLVVSQKPDDPIEFLANHIKHTRVNDVGQLEEANCDVCKGLHPKPTLVASEARPKRPVPLQEALLADSRLHVDKWRDAKVYDAWTDLTRIYGPALKWWDMARLTRSRVKPVIQPIVNRKAWKTVRVFVSSTFKDMFCEREWLVKHVFPDLRNWCAERKLFLVECDLRWGVPKDSNSGEVLAACLNEIDRCREENTMPYFVGLLGHRYGWVPSEEDFPNDIKRQYCWIPGMSVTSLEVCTGALWDNNPHSIFLMRDAKILDGAQQLAAAADHSVDADKIVSGYRETDQEAEASLEMLKKLVRESQSDDQVADYSCELNGLMPDGAGGHRLNLTGLQEFGDKVSEFLKSRIAQQFVSVSSETQSSMELQHTEHEQFMEQRGAVLFGRSDEVERIMDYIDQPAEEGTNVPVLIVSGSAGTGKSSIIAHVAQKCIDSASYSKVVVHFVGATAGSTTLHRVIARLWYECLELREAEIPTDFEELKRSLEIVFRRASDLTKNNAGIEPEAESNANTDDSSETEADSDSEAVAKAESNAEVKAENDAEVNAETDAEVKAETDAEVKAETDTEVKAEVKTDAEAEAETAAVAEAEDQTIAGPSAGIAKPLLVIFIDAVNQMDDEGDTLSLLWLPKQLPHNLRLVVSTLQGTTLNALRAANLPEVKVKPLTDDSRKFIITQFFMTYNKRLAVNDVLQLLSHADAGRPLWLSLACEELRVFGTFELLSQKIKSLSGDLSGLLKQILERVISETTVGGDLMQAALSLIRASRFGLVESELQQLLVVEPTLPPGAKLDCVKTEREKFEADIEKLPMQTWAVIYLGLRQFLRPIGSSGDGRLDFYHRSISKVIRATMLDKPELRAAWHRRLADYFDTKVSSYHRKAEELPYHYLQLKEHKKLEMTLLDDQMFDQLYKEDTKVQLLMFWRELGGYRVAAERYVKAFNYAWPYRWFPDKMAKAQELEESDREVKQWVETVGKFSSQFSDLRRSANFIVGPPRVYPKYEDNNRTWAPKMKGQRDYVELQFRKAVYVTDIIIYETFHAGGVRSISVRNPDGQWQRVYKAKEISDIESARKFKPKIERLPFKVNKIRIDTDASVCNDWVEIDAVKLIGRTVYKAQEEVKQAEREQKQKQETPQEQQAIKSVKENAIKSSKQWVLSKQWVGSISDFSSQYGSSTWGAERIIGPPTIYPKHGDFGGAWAPKETGTKEFVQLQFERPVYIAAVCVFETYHAGGIRSISVIDERDKRQRWQPIYQATKVVDLNKSRKFVPFIIRPNFKCNQLRIDIDQSACNSWCELDAVALYGYDEFNKENIHPQDLLKREYPEDMMEPVIEEEEEEDEDEEEDDEFDVGNEEKAITSFTDEEFTHWLTKGVKLGGFLVDIGQFEIGERHLVYVNNVVQVKYDVSNIDAEQFASLPLTGRKKYAELFFVMVVLYRSWFTKFVHLSNAESQRAHSRGKQAAKMCYEVHKLIYSTDEIYFGEVVSACSFFIPSLCDDIIELFQAKNYKRGLVELYSLKGSQTQHDNIEMTRGFHENAVKLAYSEFGKFHVKTARAHQLYGQMLWNRWMRYQDEKTTERMNELSVHYWTEYEILENIFGPDHTLTIRSRADNIMALKHLGRQDEASELSKKQPEGIDVSGNL